MDQHTTPYEESRKIIIQYAIFRLENALILAGTILLTTFYTRPFVWWPVWGWPLLGLLGMGIMFYSSLTNTDANAKLLLEATQRAYNVKRIIDTELRGEVEQAMAYQQRIIQFLNENKNESILWGRAEETAQQMYRWVEHIYKLAVMLDRYKRDRLTKKEMKELPEEIKNLKDRQAAEKDESLLARYQDAISSKQRQYDSIQSLNTRMKQAGLNLEQSLSSLATVDSQIRLLSVHTKDRGKGERLQADIGEQVNQLGDLLTSLDEVYSQS